jgi:hypothetical protein
MAQRPVLLSAGQRLAEFVVQRSVPELARRPVR